MENTQTSIGSNRWERPWRVSADSPNKFEVHYEDVNFIYALHFMGEVPETLTVIIGGAPVIFTMHSKPYWNGFVIPVGKLRYHRVQFVLPEGCTFDDVRVLVSPKIQPLQPEVSEVLTRYLCVWYDRTDPTTRKYNWLVYGSGMGAMYLVKDSDEYTGYESAEALFAQNLISEYPKIGAIQPNYTFDDHSSSNYLQWW